MIRILNTDPGHRLFQVHGMYGPLQCPHDLKPANLLLLQLISDQRPQTVSGRTVRADAKHQHPLLFLLLHDLSDHFMKCPGEFFDLKTEFCKGFLIRRQNFFFPVSQGEHHRSQQILAVNMIL